MAKNEAKIKFTAETGGFNDAIKKASDEMSQLSAKMKLNDTQMKATGVTVEALENKHKILSDQLTASKSKTEALTQKVNKAAEIFGENSTEVTKLRTQLLNAQNAEEKIRQAINACNDELTAQRDAAKQAESATDKLTETINDQQSELDRLKKSYSDAVLQYGKGSKEAKTLKGEIKTLSGELKENKTVLSDVSDKADELDKSLEEVGEAAKDAESGFTVFKGTLATFGGNVLTGVVNGFKEAAASLVSLAGETREYRTEMGKLETAFDSANFTTEAAKKTYKDLYAVLGDEGQAVEASNMLAKLCDTEEDLSVWTKIATGVYGTFGNSLPIENLAEAANETAKTGSITGGLADALNWAGVSEEEFQNSLDGCSSEQERQALITRELNGLYSYAAQEYKKTNKSVMDANRANSDYTDTLAAFGEKIEPVTTALQEGFNGLLTKLLELVEGVDMEAFTSAIDEGFKVLTEDVLPAVMDGLGWIIDNKDIIIAGLAGIAAGFIAFKVASLIQGVVSAMQGMTVAQYALNLAMSLNPIGIIIALIAGLVAAFIVLWNNCEGFRNFFTGLWEGICEVVSSVVDAIVGFFTGLWDSIVGIFSGIADWFGGIFGGAKDKVEASDCWGGVADFFGGVWDGICGAFSAVGDWFGNTFSAAKDAASNAWSDAKENFGIICEGVQGAFSKVGDWFGDQFSKAKENAANAWSNAKETFSNIKDKVTGAFSTVGGWFKDQFSNAFNNTKNAFSGIGNFFSNTWNKVKSTTTSIFEKVKSAITKPIETAKNTIKGIVDKVVGFFKGMKISLPKIKLPHFKITGKLSIAPPEIPKLSIDWYKDGGILLSPTIFGMNGNKLMAGGEAGPEAILPIDKLEGYVAGAIEKHMNVVNLDKLAAAVEDLASRPIEMFIGDRPVAVAIASANDSVSGLRSSFKSRGLAIE